MAAIPAGTESYRDPGVLVNTSTFVNGAAIATDGNRASAPAPMPAAPTPRNSAPRDTSLVVMAARLSERPLLVAAAVAGPQLDEGAVGRGRAGHVKAES